MKRLASYMCIAAMMFGCAQPDSLGPSDLAQILEFGVSGQNGVTLINQQTRTIDLTVASDVDLSSVTPSLISVSTFARLDPLPSVVRDFRTDVVYTVTAESGVAAQYTVRVTQASPEVQLENSDLDAWHSVGKYSEPGASSATIWATGNAGVATLGAANVTPFESSPGDTGVKLETRDLGNLGQLVGQRMGSGSFFTGMFKLNISDPLSSAQFGVPFTARPVSWSVDLAYQPGTPYLSGKGQPITDRTDSADVYLVLEDRSIEPWRRVATGWIRIGNVIANLTTKTIPLIYGELPQGTPSYMLPRNGQTYAPLGTRPTHISVVFASSCRGDLFEGGVGSTLMINNIVLNYR